MKRVILILACLAVFGCSTNDGRPYSPPPAPVEGKVLVYLMRTNVVLGSAYPTVFYVNGSAVAGMKDFGYTWIYVSPGVYKFSAGVNSKGVSISIPIMLGRDYFVEYSQEYSGYQSYYERIKEVEPSAGKAMIGEYTYKADGSSSIF